MKRLPIFILTLLLTGLNSCKKEENSTPDQFPEWLQAKITELVPEQNLCEITDVTIIEYNGKKYYHLYCGIWSCMYCHLFDEKGNHPDWDIEGWDDFVANQKVISTVPACDQ